MSAGRCVHFNGIGNDTCDAGVKYDDVRDTSTKPYSLPCLAKYNTAGAKCDKCRVPTAEELAAEEAEYKRTSEGIRKARAAIVAHCGRPWKKGMPGKSGVIACPVCDKPDALRFGRAGYNGHVHASCLTEGCVSWME